VALILVGFAYVAWGKVQEVLVARAVEHKLTEAGLTPEALKKLGAAGYQADPQILARIATGGQPLGRWKEGLMFEGIAPMPWLKSAANWFPGTEEVQPSEIRVIFMGGSPLPALVRWAPPSMSSWAMATGSSSTWVLAPSRTTWPRGFL
jgi:hypothetical protein